MSNNETKKLFLILTPQYGKNDTNTNEKGASFS